MIASSTKCGEEDMWEGMLGYARSRSSQWLTYNRIHPMQIMERNIWNPCDTPYIRSKISPVVLALSAQCRVSRQRWFGWFWWFSSFTFHLSPFIVTHNPILSSLVSLVFFSISIWYRFPYRAGSVETIGRAIHGQRCKYALNLFGGLMGFIYLNYSDWSSYHNHVSCLMFWKREPPSPRDPTMRPPNCTFVPLTA